MTLIENSECSLQHLRVSCYLVDLLLLLGTYSSFSLPFLASLISSGNLNFREFYLFHYYCNPFCSKICQLLIKISIGWKILWNFKNFGDYCQGIWFFTYRYFVKKIVKLLIKIPRGRKNSKTSRRVELIVMEYEFHLRYFLISFIYYSQSIW